MKELTLYIDKWYVIGAVSTDGIARLIELPNHEDRFWLYFYEDVNNNRVIYGKDNERHWRDRENHYFGDIFSMITNPDLTFTSFGHPLALEEIFRASGMFDNIKSECDQNTSKISTYISFSEDITDAERLVFQRILKDNDFEIKESVAHIEHLALEYGARQHKFQEDGHFLVLNACNENLHYSLYKHEENMFVLGNEESLSGYGNDLRSRALLETIIESVNRRSGFLKTKEEKETECMRMSQYLDNWLVKLDHANPVIPITIPNVTFSELPYNNWPVTIIKKDIDARTSGIVDEIIRKISSFVKDSNVRSEEIKGILFIGNTFTNSQFKQSIREKFLIDDNEFVIFRDSVLPNIVSVYSVMDCAQFSVQTNDFNIKSKQELQRIQNAIEEAKRIEEAKAEEAKRQTQFQKTREEERNYNNAIDKIQEFEDKKDFTNMKEWCEIALKIKPDNNTAKNKLDEANQKIAEEAAVAKQYSNLIKQANNSFREGRWADALSQSNAALNVRKTTEAQKIKDESSQKLSILSDIKDFLTRADIFEAQQSFNEAINELQKVLTLDDSNKEAKRRISLINKKIQEKSLKLTDLINQENNAESNSDYVTAIKVCEQLIEVDVENIAKWSGKLQALQIRKENKDKERKQLAYIKSKIDNAIFNEDWQQVVLSCKEALKIKQDSEIENKLIRANERFNIIEKNQAFQHEYDAVKALMVDRKWEEAQQKINEMSKKYTDKQSLLKDLRKKIYEAEDSLSSPKKGSRKVINGFSIDDNKDKVEDDNFFSSNEIETNEIKKQRKTATLPKTNKKETGNEFFNSDFRNSKNKNNKSVTNDDFNF